MALLDWLSLGSNLHVFEFIVLTCIRGQEGEAANGKNVSPIPGVPKCILLLILHLLATADLSDPLW